MGYLITAYAVAALGVFSYALRIHERRRRLAARLAGQEEAMAARNAATGGRASDA